MLNTFNSLRQLGEDVTIKDKTIKVKFSLLLGELSIKKDIATSQLTYTYQQLSDLTSALMLFFLSAMFVEQQMYSIAVFFVGLSLFRTTICIIKEIKVTAIKREIMAVSRRNSTHHDAFVDMNITNETAELSINK